MRLERQARVAPSLIRFGHFENLRYSNDTSAIKTLADFCLQHHFTAFAEEENPYQAMLLEVVKHTAKLIAHWQSLGFVHGTMNTDNHSLIGLTIDHGTGEFLNIYDPSFVSANDDVKRLFAFDQQPSVGLWNCTIFAKTLSSLVKSEDIEAALAEYASVFETHYLKLMREKLGLKGEHADDSTLITELLEILKNNSMPYSPSIRGLSNLSPVSEKSGSVKLEKLRNTLGQNEWLARYYLRTDPNDEHRRSGMDKVNPKYVLTANDIELVVKDALEEKYTSLNNLLKLVSTPF